jgi:invasion protein IalB
VIKESVYVRISKVFCRIVLTSALVASGAGAAMSQSDPEQPPPGAAKNFGPRKGAAQAQGGQPAEGSAETVAKHGKWEVQCAGQGEAKACGMLQASQSDKNKNIGVTVIVSKLKQQGKASTIMRVLVPIGVYLPTGVAVEIDGNALPNRLQFTRCTPRVCEAFGEASPETMKRFTKGSDATFFVYDRPGNGFPMKISLEGFAAGLGSLDKL